MLWLLEFLRAGWSPWRGSGIGPETEAHIPVQQLHSLLFVIGVYWLETINNVLSLLCKRRRGGTERNMCFPRVLGVPAAHWHDPQPSVPAQGISHQLVLYTIFFWVTLPPTSSKSFIRQEELRPGWGRLPQTSSRQVPQTPVIKYNLQAKF